MEKRTMPVLLLDTNVWLDYFVPGRAGKDAAARLIAQCSRDDITLLYASHSIQDVFFLSGLSYKRMMRNDGIEIDETWSRAINGQAWECVRTTREIATAADTGQGDIWLAEKYRDLHGDFEDDLVIAVAQRVKADYLVTSDMQLIAKSPVAALTPEDMLTVLETCHS